jgi:hypothetical protein
MDLGMDVSWMSPQLINGFIAIECNFLLEIVRLPFVLWILRRRSMLEEPPASRSSEDK